MSSEWTPRKGWENACQKALPPILFCGATSTLCAFGSTSIFLAPFLAPIGIVATILVPIFHGWYANKYLLSPTYRRLSPTRRLFLRWGSRMLFLELILYVYTPSILWVAIVACPMGFWVFTRAQLFCIEWQLEKEANGEPLTKIEKVILGVLFGISAILFFIMLLFAFLFGLAIQETIPIVQDLIQNISELPQMIKDLF